MKGPPVKNVYLSYAQEDTQSAKDLAKILKSRGLNVWLDDAEIFPGDNWGSAVAKALEDADAMVVLLSPDAVRSKWVNREIDFALGESRFRDRLIPVVIRPTPRIPWILEKRHLIVAKPRQRPAAFRRVADQLLASAE